MGSEGAVSSDDRLLGAVEPAEVPCVCGLELASGGIRNSALHYGH